MKGSGAPTGRPSFLWLLGAFALAAACLLSVYQASGGRFMLPLDDSYIHLQYAKMAAAGQPFVYTPGSLPSGGATSPLWVLLLSPAFVLGLSGVKGAAASFVLSTVIYGVAAMMVVALGRRLGDSATGVAAGLLFLLNGHLLWNFLSGMETGVFTLLLLAAVLGAAVWLREERRGALRMMLVSLALLPVARPEGFGLVLIAVAFALSRRGDGPRLPAATMLCCLLPGLFWLLALKLLTGEWKPSGMIVKGLTDRPDLSWSGKFALAAETLAAIPLRFYRNEIPDDGYALFKGTTSMPYVAAGGAALALFGGLYALWQDGRSRRFGATTLAMLVWVGGVSSVAASALPFIHQQRYLAPWTALIAVLAPVGVRRIAQLFQQHEETAFRTAVAALVLLSIPSVPWWIAEYGRNGRDIYHQHRVLTFSVEQLPPGERIALTDAGVLAYYTNRGADDLIGLTTARFARANASGEGAMLEELARTPLAQRPRLLLTYRDWFSPEFPLGEPVGGARLAATSITSGLFLGMYPIDWAAIERGQAIPIGTSETLLLTVDTGDLSEEARAHYRWGQDSIDERARDWPRPPSPIARTATGGVEGGRQARWEEFEIELPQSSLQTTLTLVARLAPAKPVHAEVLEVTIRSLENGFAVAQPFPLPTPSRPGACAEVRIPLTELLDRAGGTRFRFRVRSVAPADVPFRSFRYGILQERP